MGEQALSKELSREWRCFHCDDVFLNEVDARNHFGSDQCSEPACRIKVAGEFALLQALRNAEDQLARYRREDSDILRAMWSAEADHAAALRREEEKGYERGLRDAQAHPETIGLQRADQIPLEHPMTLERAREIADLEGIRLTQGRGWVIDLNGSYTAEALEAIAVLMREEGK